MRINKWCCKSGSQLVLVYIFCIYTKTTFTASLVDYHFWFQRTSWFPCLNFRTKISNRSQCVSSRKGGGERGSPKDDFLHRSYIIKMIGPLPICHYRSSTCCTVYLCHYNPQFVLIKDAPCLHIITNSIKGSNSIWHVSIQTR